MVFHTHGSAGYEKFARSIPKGRPISVPPQCKGFRIRSGVTPGFLRRPLRRVLLHVHGQGPTRPLELGSRREGEGSSGRRNRRDFCRPQHNPSQNLRPVSLRCAVVTLSMDRRVFTWWSLDRLPRFPNGKNPCDFQIFRDVQKTLKLFRPEKSTPE
jgi:hypothetical protein